MMAEPTRRINVGIASSDDVAEERAAVLRVLERWNAGHFTAMLNAISWELASVPSLGDHPQNILNKLIIPRCQLLVAICWSRLGTPTPTAPSDTVDEINEFIRLKGAGRAMLYFCTRSVPHERIYPIGLARLRDCKAEMRSRGLYWEYQSVEEFESLLYEHLDGKVTEFLAGHFPPPGRRGKTDSLNAPLLRLWHHWLRINSILSLMLHTHREAWSEVRAEFKRALALRSKLRRAGWFTLAHYRRARPAPRGSGRRGGR